MAPRRKQKMQEVVLQRQLDVAVLLENVHDKHNIGAVLRSCDSVGVMDIFVLITSPRQSEQSFKLGQNSSSGAMKWVNVYFYKDREACFDAMRSRYGLIYGTLLGEKSVSLYDLNLTESVVLAFGNEKHGLTPETAALLDGNFLIPQMGMVESLNVSVAAALSLYECYRQRQKKGMYHDKHLDGQRKALLQHYHNLNDVRERNINHFMVEKGWSDEDS